MATAKEEFKKADAKEKSMVKPGKMKAFEKNEKVEEKALKKMGAEKSKRKVEKKRPGRGR